MIAAAALAFTACTNDELVSQNEAPAAAAQEAVGFDVYVPGATQTRAGRANVMTTGIMQQTGFGVYAYQNDDDDFTATYDATVGPNFMWNQQVNYTTTGNGWYYSPLKYWPNETMNDSQTSPAEMPSISGTNVDKLTFFAYAPWVKADAIGTVSIVNANIEAVAGVGIKKIKGNTGAPDPDNSVDLLWGVAPVGGLSYQNVAGKTTSVSEGMPLIGLVKPAVNTSLKLLFQHSLARIGVKVVAAVDQVAAGGALDYANTKITIDNIKITGEFGVDGTLNLNNTTTGPNVPNWTINTLGNAGGTPLVIDEGAGLAAHLVWDGATDHQQTVTGVTTTVADAIQVRSKYDANYLTDCATAEDGSSTPLTYSATRPYFANAADIATPTYATFNNWAKTGSTYYLQKYVTNSGVTYTDITSTINTKYPIATVWENIYSLSTDHYLPITTAELAETHKAKTAYRRVGNTFTATGTYPQIGDCVFLAEPAAVPAPTYTGTYYKAKPNYFMVIPPTDPSNKTIKVKITYYVSTTDANVANEVVYTKNEVEKEITLPSFVNGKSYDLKLILGLTSVKIEAEVSDWTTTNVQVDLPQNTAE